MRNINEIHQRGGNVLAFVKKEAGFGGELLEWREPAITNPYEVLIEVKACGICGSDVHFYEWPEDLIMSSWSARKFH